MVAIVGRRDVAGTAVTAPGENNAAPQQRQAQPPPPLPAWVEEILDPPPEPADTSQIDDRTILARFVRDLESASLGDDGERVLRACLLAMNGRLDDREE